MNNSNKLKFFALFLFLFSVLRLSAQEFGVTTQEVTVTAEDAHHNVQVWEVQPQYTKSGEYEVSIKHAAPGIKGSFHIIAWADTDNNGLPDKEIGQSELKIVSAKGAWSSWRFKSDYKRIFIGNKWDGSDKIIYYQKGGKVEGYKGLSDKLHYSRSFTGKPTQSVSPRYTNIRVKMISNETWFGITSKEVTSKAVNANHKVQVWEVLPKYTQNGEYRVGIKHAAAGENGSFFIIAWADTDNDGKPDKEIGRSKLKTASIDGDWSFWEFTSNYDRIFVGNAWDRADETIYYQKGGKVEGYIGLSNQIFYSRTFSGKPTQSTSPRYINIKVKRL